MKKLLGCFLALIFLFPVSVMAIPTLGVAPGAPGSPGVYLGSLDSDLYLTTFANQFLGLPGGDGFIMPLSEGELSVWYGENNGNVDKSIDIYLASTQGPFTFDGLNSISSNFLSVKGNYKEPIWGFNLGNVNGGDWSLLAGSNVYGFDDFPKLFYYRTGTIGYLESFEPGDWMYAAADINGRGGIGGGEFSPKTTSATAPEPATILLLGVGLIGVAAFGRRKLKRRHS